MKSTVTYPTLAKYLLQYGLENVLEEIAYQVNESYNLDEFSCDQLCEWIKTLTFLSDKNNVLNTILNELIDGYCLKRISESDWVRVLNLPLSDLLLIKACFNDWGESVFVPYGIPQSVVVGIMADLSRCSTSEASLLIEADRVASESGRFVLLLYIHAYLYYS